MPDDDTTLRFLADMGVSWRVVEWLRSQSYDAKHLREEESPKRPLKYRVMITQK